MRLAYRIKTQIRQSPEPSLFQRFLCTRRDSNPRKKRFGKHFPRTHTFTLRHTYATYSPLLTQFTPFLTNLRAFFSINYKLICRYFTWHSRPFIGGSYIRLNTCVNVAFVLVIVSILDVDTSSNVSRIIPVQPESTAVGISWKLPTNDNKPSVT